MTPAVLVLVSFLASGVEAIEALTIVLAVGLTRGWRSTLAGVLAASVALAAVVAVLGPALTAIPIDALRVVVGGLLLVFGLQWLRKAILRAGGYRPLHDEQAIYQREVDAARTVSGAGTADVDWYAFTIAFKGVLLEGLEVAFIVVTFGSNGGSVALAAAGAIAAVLVVIAVGLWARAPLARVPENTMKFSVGLMLVTYGSFWAAEGAGGDWPGGDVFLIVLLTALHRVRVAPGAGVVCACRTCDWCGPVISVVAGFARFLYRFVVGDDPVVAAGVLVAIAATALLEHAGVAGYWILPPAVVGLLATSIWREIR